VQRGLVEHRPVARSLDCRRQLNVDFGRVVEPDDALGER
jgi:hypothetical protein